MRARWLSLGVILGSLAYPSGLLLAAHLHHRNLIDATQVARPCKETT